MQGEEVVVRVVSKLADEVAVGLEDTLFVEYYAMRVKTVKAAITRVVLYLVERLPLRRLAS